MASHVVVIDTSARRATIKVTPAKPLSEVLEEACAKLGYTASQYTLKHNNKPVDLSRTIRLSGLSSGAKLELVQQSRSPSVVSIALQLPESEAQGLPNARLTDKFPSTTTLWLVLRKFEAGVAGGGGGAGTRNLTAKSVPVTENGSSGAGGLYYLQPVINIMGRELSTFTDLQKTLGQLGFNSGSTLLRLSYKTSEMPLHEAMAQIDEFFKSQGEDIARPSMPDVSGPSETHMAEPDTTTSTDDPKESNLEEADTPMANTNTPEPTTSTSTAPTISSRPIQIFSPPTSSTPSAAAPTSTYNPADYIPTVEHAQSHQRLLSQSSRNIRLPTDAEIQAQTLANKERLSAILSVEIKVRFPDQTSLVSTFNQRDTGKTLYDFVRECLDPTITSEPFLLRYPSTNGRGHNTVPDSASDEAKLIQGLELKGRILMTFSWHPEKTSPEIRTRKVVLKDELREKAKEIEVVDVGNLAAGQQDEQDEAKRKGEETVAEKKKGGEGEGGPKKMPKWLKLPGKK